MDKYVLFTKDSEKNFDKIEDAIKAYENCEGEYKFLYEPNKTYFLGTISSTGSIVGRDHKYHKDTAKCYGLFRAVNKNQIDNFLKNAKWHHQGSSSKSSVARLYGNGPYGSLYNSDKDWEEFCICIKNNYLTTHNISFFGKLNDTYGAIDINTYKCNPQSNPYCLY